MRSDVVHRWQTDERNRGNIPEISQAATALKVYEGPTVSDESDGRRSQTSCLLPFPYLICLYSFHRGALPFFLIISCTHKLIPLHPTHSSQRLHPLLLQVHWCVVIFWCVLTCRVWSAVSRAACLTSSDRGYPLHPPGLTVAHPCPSTPPPLSRSPPAYAN